MNTLAIELAKSLWLPILVLAGLIYINVRIFLRCARLDRQLQRQRQEQALFEAIYAPTLTDEEVAEFHSTRWDGD